MTRATTAIALYLLHTIHLAAPQSVWVLTSHATYSTKYRRSSYAPGLSDKQKQTHNKNSNNNEVTKETKTTIIPSLNNGKTLTIIMYKWG
jgi:hypothetical protein